MRVAGLSFDVDSVASHLDGYGFGRGADRGEAYTYAIPRILDLLDKHGARATFFLIAAEAEHHRGVVRQLKRQGHEIASHSLTHPIPFTALSDRDLQHEAQKSRELLEEVSDSQVTGFRAPGFGLDERVLAAISRAGYAYDASAFPSPLLLANHLAIGRRSRNKHPNLRRASAWREAWGFTRIHMRRTTHRPIVEVPASTLPVIRFPYYHTPKFLLPDRLGRAIDAIARTRRTYLAYAFHAVDFLGLETDGLDPLIGRHPGMRHTLPEKLELANRAVRNLARWGSVVTLRRLVHDFSQTRPVSGSPKAG